MAGTINLEIYSNGSGGGVSRDPLGPLLHGDTVELLGAGFGTLPIFAFAGGKTGRIETSPIGLDTAGTDNFIVNTERPKYIEVDADRGKVWTSEVSDGNIGTADNAIIAHNWGSQIPNRAKIKIHWLNKTNCDATTFQWKQFRGEATFNYTDGGPEALMFGWRNGNKQIFVRNTADTVSPQYAVYTSENGMNPTVTPTWITYDFYEQLSDIDVENGVCDYRSVANGVSYSLFSNDAVKHFATGITATRQYHVLQNILTNFNDGLPTLSDIFVDDFYVQVAAPDTDLVSVYLCNTNDFNTTTIKQIQRPLAGWTDTNARVELNTDGLPAGSYYLLAIANKNTKLAERVVNI